MAQTFPQVYLAQLREVLYPGNEGVQFSVDHSAFVSQGKIVHVPGAGNPPEVLRNNTVFPMTPQKRVDTDLTYAIDDFRTKPFYLPHDEGFQLNYNKMSSLNTGMEMNLRRQVVFNTYYRWVDSITVDGASSPLPDANKALLNGAGNAGSKGLKKEDWYGITEKMDAANIPLDGRHVVMTPAMYRKVKEAFGGDLIEVQGLDRALVERGVVAMLDGVMIHRRSILPLWDRSDKSLKAYDATSGDTGMIFWHENMVGRAASQFFDFQNLRDPQYQGDIMSALIYAGGVRLPQVSIGQNGEASTVHGVYALIQG